MGSSSKANVHTWSAFDFARPSYCTSVMKSVSSASVIACRTRSSRNFGFERFMPNGLPRTLVLKFTCTSGFVLSNCSIARMSGTSP